MGTLKTKRAIVNMAKGIIAMYQLPPQNKNNAAKTVRNIRFIENKIVLKDLNSI